MQLYAVDPSLLIRLIKNKNKKKQSNINWKMSQELLSVHANKQDVSSKHFSPLEIVLNQA